MLPVRVKRHKLQPAICSFFPGVAWLCRSSAGCLCAEISWSLIHQTDLEAVQSFKPLWSVYAQVIQTPLPTLCSPLDPLFVEIGDVFLAEQKKEFGTNHIYSVDPFNELLPPNRSVKHSHIKVAKLIICKFKHVCFPSVFFHWLSICLSSVDYLSSVGRAVFQGLASDSEAVWLMQGWLFMFDQVSQFSSKLDQR